MLLEAPGHDAPYLDAQVGVDGDGRAVALRLQRPTIHSLRHSLTFLPIQGTRYLFLT